MLVFLMARESFRILQLICVSEKYTVLKCSIERGQEYSKRGNANGTFGSCHFLADVQII